MADSMTGSATAYGRYRSDAIETMSPARIVVALYDRLVLDLDRATAAIEANDAAGAHHALVHAQEIVDELHDSLDIDAWSAAIQLSAIYEHLSRELVAANIAKDPSRVAACRSIVSPLRDAWREAAGIVATQPGAGAGASA